MSASYFWTSSLTNFVLFSFVNSAVVSCFDWPANRSTNILYALLPLSIFLSVSFASQFAAKMVSKSSPLAVSSAMVRIMMVYNVSIIFPSFDPSPSSAFLTSSSFALMASPHPFNFAVAFSLMLYLLKAAGVASNFDRLPSFKPARSWSFSGASSAAAAGSSAAAGSVAFDITISSRSSCSG